MRTLNFLQWLDYLACQVFILLARIYQHALSPYIGRQCKFVPTCSNYFIQSLQHRGLAVGLALGIWRILRCNPFCRGGYDPVLPRPGQKVN